MFSEVFDALERDGVNVIWIYWLGFDLMLYNVLIFVSRY